MLSSFVVIFAMANELRAQEESARTINERSGDASDSLVFLVKQVMKSTNLTFVFSESGRDSDRFVMPRISCQR